MYLDRLDPVQERLDRILIGVKGMYLDQMKYRENKMRLQSRLFTY